ncbi:MAG: phosphonate metabolism transcriptional regulator PhnF [Hyphomicrobiales bacterium]|nr:MAG: phosphonate metabolism transcriptional regulator PhnF [Hyphomicrobiales bacterium]
MTKSDDRGGVALWRRIADDIRLDIVGGKLNSGEQLPTEARLAERFSANRHTVRRALAVLAAEGVVRAEQGRGTFVDTARRLSYRIGKRTRFSEGLAGQARDTHGEVLSARQENAAANVARGLDIRPGARVVRLETLSHVDGKPLSRGTSWFPYQRFPTIGEVYAETRSITRALKLLGVEDYSRGSTRISARYGTPEEVRSIGLVPGAVMLVTEIVDLDAEERPIQYALTRFPADRLELVV